MKKTARIFCMFLIVVSLVSICAVAFAGGEYTVSTGGGRLNMRKSASTSATIILYIPNGTPVDDKSDDVDPVEGWNYIGSWGYLSGESAGYTHYKKGWVISSYLK